MKAGDELTWAGEIAWYAQHRVPVRVQASRERDATWIERELGDVPVRATGEASMADQVMREGYIPKQPAWVRA